MPLRRKGWGGVAAESWGSTQMDLLALSAGSPELFTCFLQVSSSVPLLEALLSPRLALGRYNSIKLLNWIKRTMCATSSQTKQIHNTHTPHTHSQCTHRHNSPKHLRCTHILRHMHTCARQPPRCSKPTHRPQHPSLCLSSLFLSLGALQCLATARTLPTPAVLGPSQTLIAPFWPSLLHYRLECSLHWTLIKMRGWERDHTFLVDSRAQHLLKATQQIRAEWESKPSHSTLEPVLCYLTHRVLTFRW